MPRKPRFFVADIPYHIVQRGNNRNPIFFSDEDYLFFLEVLREAKIKYPCLIYSYCLMANHFHLLVEPQEKENVSLLMKLLGAKYVNYEKSPILDLDPWYSSLGSNETERQLEYRKFFQNLMPEANGKLIREMTDKGG